MEKASIKSSSIWTKPQVTLPTKILYIQRSKKHNWEINLPFKEKPVKSLDASPKKLSAFGLLKRASAKRQYTNIVTTFEGRNGRNGRVKFDMIVLRKICYHGNLKRELQPKVKSVQYIGGRRDESAVSKWTDCDF